MNRHALHSAMTRRQPSRHQSRLYAIRSHGCFGFSNLLETRQSLSLPAGWQLYFHTTRKHSHHTQLSNFHSDCIKSITCFIKSVSSFCMSRRLETLGSPTGLHLPGIRFGVTFALDCIGKNMWAGGEEMRFSGFMGWSTSRVVVILGSVSFKNMVRSAAEPSAFMAGVDGQGIIGVEMWAFVACG